MNRRQFLGKSAGILALSSIASQQLFAAAPNKGRIGIQLYSVRNDLPNDFVGTLRKISAMGYSAIEPYGFRSEKFFGYTMKELSDLVGDMGMSISGTHTGSGILPEDINAPEWDFWKNCAQWLKSGGGQWAVQAGFPGAQSVDDLKRIAAHFNRVGQVCRAHGVNFAYHNHHREFAKIEDKVILDFLIENTDPQLVSFQFDTGHAVRGGADVVRYLRDYKNRIPLWHASDYDVEKQIYTDVGKGDVPYPEMFEIAEASGLQVLTVEQETVENIFGSLEFNFNYLKQFEWTKVL